MVLPIPRRGDVDDALQRDRVSRVDQQRQIGERVLDLGALVEARAADHLVRQAVANERVLEHARLRVGAVEDGDVGVGDALLGQPLDLAGDVAGLFVLVGQLAHADRLAAGGLGPELLALAARVARDDRVRGVEDAFGRAIVLLELDHAGVGEVLLEVEDVAHVGAAEAVDRLVVVADDDEVAVLARQQLDPAVLHGVGVLVLVDEDLLEDRR